MDLVVLPQVQLACPNCGKSILLIGGAVGVCCEQEYHLSVTIYQQSVTEANAYRQKIREELARGDAGERPLLIPMQPTRTVIAVFSNVPSDAEVAN